VFQNKVEYWVEAFEDPAIMDIIAQNGLDLSFDNHAIDTLRKNGLYSRVEQLNAGIKARKEAIRPFIEKGQAIPPPKKYKPPALSPQEVFKSSHPAIAALGKFCKDQHDFGLKKSGKTVLQNVTPMTLSDGHLAIKLPGPLGEEWLLCVMAGKLWAYRASQKSIANSNVWLEVEMPDPDNPATWQTAGGGSKGGWDKMSWLKWPKDGIAGGMALEFKKLLMNAAEPIRQAQQKWVSEGIEPAAPPPLAPISGGYDVSPS
jgi:hypothetical protein